MFGEHIVLMGLDTEHIVLMGLDTEGLASIVSCDTLALLQDEAEASHTRETIAIGPSVSYVRSSLRVMIGNGRMLYRS